MKAVKVDKEDSTVGKQHEVVGGMTHFEKCAYLINTMRVYAKQCKLDDLREIYDTLDIAEGEGLLLADTKDVAQFLKPILADLPNVDKLQYMGLFVDTMTGQKFKEPDDAIAEIARRLERVHLFNDVMGNYLPTELCSTSIIDVLSELDMKKFVSLPIFPITYKLTFKDKRKPVFLQFREDGSKLLPLVVTGKEKEVRIQSMKKALIKMREQLV